MPAANWDTVAPTPGTPANSYEYGVDVQIGGSWINIPDIVDLVPTFTNKTRARGTYATKGKTVNRKYATDVNLTFNIEPVRDLSGQYQSILQSLIDISDLMGEANLIPVRFFDVRGAGYAYQGTAGVEARQRAGTGADEAGWFTVTLSGQGDFVRVTNPVTVAQAPGVASATPTARAATQTVLVKGSGFTTATQVKFGATNATSFTIIDDYTILAVMPAGSAGSAAVSVVSPSGTSTALPYTRGA